MIEQNHLDLLLDLNTDENPHSGGDLLDHLRGTHDFLQAWGNDQAMCPVRLPRSAVKLRQWINA